MATTSQPTRAPNKALYLTDYARSVWDIGALSATLPALARASRGDGHAVLVIPGLGATDMSTLILRRFLSTLGYATYGWELGRNIGPTELGQRASGEEQATLNRQGPRGRCQRSCAARCASRSPRGSCLQAAGTGR